MEKIIERYFYIIYHEDCDTTFVRSVLNTSRKNAITDFLNDNKFNKNFTWAKAKKNGWICKKVVLQYWVKK